MKGSSGGQISLPLQKAIMGMCLVLVLPLLGACTVISTTWNESRFPCL